MNTALTTLAITAMTWFCCEAADAQEGSRSKPNVILIMTDDQGYGDLACLGNPWIDSPNIDRLHAESIRLTNFHVSPMCSPTRAALLTGRHCRHVGVRQTNNCTNLIARDVPTMADVFAQNGYRTGMFGKWHLGETYPYRPHDRGFHEAVYHGNGAIGTTGDVWGNDYFDDTYHHNGEPKQVLRLLHGRLVSRRRRDSSARATSAATRSSATWRPTWSMARCWWRTSISFATGTSRASSPAMRPRCTAWSPISTRTWAGSCRLLKSESLERDTILIFMTDNGTAAGAALDKQGFVRAGYNAGMRGKKTSSYEGGHRVPFFLRWPGGGLDGGRDVPQLAAHLDVLPTLMDLCGLECPDEVHSDGVSLRPLLEGNADKWPDRTIVESFTKVAMTDRWRLVHNTELYDVHRRPRTAARRCRAVSRSGPAGSKPRWPKTRATKTPGSSESSSGAEQAPHVSLTLEQWLDEERTYRTFRTSLILQGELFESTVPVEIATAGRYRITLRRWPEQLKTPIRGGDRRRPRAEDHASRSPTGNLPRDNGRR